MLFTKDSTLREVCAVEKGRAVLKKHLPLFDGYPNMAPCLNQTLSFLTGEHHMGLTPKILEAILTDLALPAETILPEIRERRSLDKLEAAGFRAGPPPFSGNFTDVELTGSIPEFHAAPLPQELSRGWILADNDRLDHAVPAIVPGSIQAALTAAGRLPDTTFGRNQELGCLESYKDWWLQLDFQRPELKHPVLTFQGVCNRCDIWLNGTFLGSHEGMFTRFSFDISEYVRDENRLTVRLHRIPFRPEAGEETNPGNNASWKDTVVFNNVYGWHYSKMPSLGIWAPVLLEEAKDSGMDHPFLRTRNAQTGRMQLLVPLRGGPSRGLLEGVIRPENFIGKPCAFACPVSGKELRLSFAIPEPRLWWPVDLGEPNLYRLTLRFTAADGRADVQSIVFGIRTVQMDPLPCGPDPQKYNWTFVINGYRHFVKGSGWCTMDALLDFSRTRYDRYLSLCRDQHIQMLRGWGSGMPETDDFYDLCDRYGIMVIQEWPTAWNSHLTQPMDMMEETVRQNTLRLRNHASLVMWGGGNESSFPYGDQIDLMGRLAHELDGTRPFHRGEPWGGSEHDYSCWWGRKDLNYNVRMQSDFYGEFGLACMPNYESVLKYLPEEEQKLWPPKAGGAFEYHTPIFGSAQDIDRLHQYAGYFLPAKDATLRKFSTASQLATATGVRHPLERARTRWPDCSGALYYKINDNFPAVSWSCIDWYGAVKLSHYLFKNAFAPLHAAVIFDRLDFLGTPESFPVWLLDDSDALRGKVWEVAVRVYDGDFSLIRSASYSGEGSIAGTRCVGNLSLTWQETDHAPLLFVAEVLVDHEPADRTFYWANFIYRKGCLFSLPQAALRAVQAGEQITITNCGEFPAVSVLLNCPSASEHFTASDGCFWLESGETRIVRVNTASGITVSAWNTPELEIRP